MSKSKPLVKLKPYGQKGVRNHNFNTFEDLKDFLKYDFSEEELNELEKNLREDRVRYMTDTGYGITAEIYYFNE